MGGGGRPIYLVLTPHHTNCETYAEPYFCPKKGIRKAISLYRYHPYIYTFGQTFV